MKLPGFPEQAWQRPARPLSPRLTDVALVIVVAVVMTLMIGVAEEPGPNRPLDSLAFLLGLTVAALLLLRRDRPLLVLIGSVGVLLVYNGLNYPAISPALPLAAAVYAASVAGRSRSAAAIVALTMAFAIGYQSLVEGTSVAFVLGAGALGDASLLAAALLLGEAVRHRRAWAAEVRARLERAERERERESARRLEGERMRIARELHDVVAHTIAAVSVQAAVAAETMEIAPDQARASLRTIRAQSRAAITELKTTVGLLRGKGGNEPRAPAPGLADLDRLLDGAGEAGIEVRLQVTGVKRALPGSIDLTAYRIVQESLTNVVRHAGATSATVRLSFEPREIELQVLDDGTNRGGAAIGGERGGGYGILGMRERATAVGGTLTAGPAPGGGFAVHARLPIERTVE